MKKFLTIFFFFVLVVAICCCTAFISWVRHHGHMRSGDISIQVREDDDQYQVYASYDRDKTWQIQRYLDQKLHAKNLFRDSRIDADVMLEDHTKFYIRNTPGRLVIRFDRDENSEEAYENMKELTEGLKARITAP